MFMDYQSNDTLLYQISSKTKEKLELMFMKHYAPNRCLYIKVAKLRTGVGSAEMSHLQIAVSKYI